MHIYKQHINKKLLTSIAFLSSWKWIDNNIFPFMISLKQIFTCVNNITTTLTNNTFPLIGWWANLCELHVSLSLKSYLVPTFLWFFQKERKCTLFLYNPCPSPLRYHHLCQHEKQAYETLSIKLHVIIFHVYDLIDSMLHNTTCSLWGDDNQRDVQTYT